MDNTRQFKQISFDHFKNTPNIYSKDTAITQKIFEITSGESCLQNEFINHRKK